MSECSDTESAEDEFSITINGQPVRVRGRISVVAALMQANQLVCRQSVTGEARFAVCGMGVCHECRVRINQQPQQLACQTWCEPGMAIVTAEAAL